MNRKSEALPKSALPTLSELSRPLEGAAGVVERPDGTRLRVVEAGSGGDVLLVHGFGMSVDAWSLVQPPLVAQGRRVVAYDRRGHAQSTCGRDGIGSAQLREDMKAVAEKYDLRDATLVCHSMAGFEALGLLPDETFRKRLRRAVLVNPVTGNAAKGAPVARMQAPLVRFGLAQRLARIRPIGRQLAAASVGSAASSNVVEATRQGMVAIPSSVTACVPMLRRESVGAALPEVDLPVHVLTGTEDQTTPAWHAELVVARAPQARIDYVADAGHMLPWEAPEVVVEAVLAEWSD